MGERYPAGCGSDRAAADSSTACGYGCALARVLATDGIVLYSGMPVIQGAEPVAQFLQSQAPLAERRVQWLPQHAESSADGQLGVTWGVMTSRPVEGPVRFGNFVSVWRRGPDGWRMVVHVQAFGAFAAPDAVTFSGAGTLNRGPEAIRRALSGGPLADWAWGPIAAGASPDGTLGWTVGEATIRARGASLPPYQGKYLSVWRRDADGQVRCVADLGNGRPAR